MMPIGRKRGTARAIKMKIVASIQYIRLQHTLIIPTPPTHAGAKPEPRSHPRVLLPASLNRFGRTAMGSPRNEGEGNKTADRNYREATTEFVESERGKREI